MKLIKKLLLITGAILLLFIATGLFLPMFIDVNDYKSKIEQLVEQNIGRKLTLQGDLELKTFPFIRVKTGELTLANPQGFPRENMLEINSAEIGIRLLPLILKKVEAGTIKFDSPVINLTKKSSGEANWEFGTDEKQQGEELKRGNSGASLAAIAVQGFEITNAQVNFADLSAGTIINISDLNLQSGSIIPGTAFPVDISTNISGSMLAESLQAKLNSEVTVDSALEKVVFKQFNSTINQSESNYQINSPQITFQIQDNRLAIDKLAVKDLTDPQTQVGMLIDNAEFDLNSLVANFSNVNADFMSADLSASLRLPKVNFDINNLSASIVSTAVSVKNNELNAQFNLPQTILDLTKSDLLVENLDGNYSYNNLDGSLLIPSILINKDRLQVTANGIKTVLGESEVMADISGGLSPVAITFDLNTDNVNLKDILSSLGTDLDTAKSTALTQLALKLSGDYEQNKLSIRQLSGKLDETTFDGIASITDFNTPVYKLMLEVGELAIDDYLPPPTQSNPQSGSDTVATAAGTPLALSQFNLTAELKADRIYSSNNDISLEKLILNLAPVTDKSSIAFKSLISGNALPEPVDLDISTLVFINSAKSNVELTALQMNAKGKTITAGLDVPLIVAPFSTGNINIENIGASFSNQQANGKINIPNLSLDTAKSSLVIKNVTGNGAFNDIDANIILPNLSVALDSQSLKINDLALDLSGKKPVGRLSIPTLDVNLANKTLGPTNVIFEGQDGRAQIDLKPTDSTDSYSGNLLAKDFNLRGILNRFDILNDLEDKSALTRIDIQSPFNFSQSRLKLENIKASIDETDISGNVEAGFGINPVYNFSIMIGELNADRYIPAAPDTESSNSTKAVAAPVAIPVELFKDTTAKGDIHFDRLLIGGAQFSNFSIGVTSNDGRLSISPIKSNFFDGSMNGNLAIDSARKSPQLDFDYSLSNVALEPALTSLGVTDKLTGNGNFNLQMGAVGKTDREMTASVKGTSNLNIENGAIKGINIQQILFNAYETYATLKNKTVNSKYNPADQTEFSSMTGSWVINGGIISGNDLQIQAPLFRINGVGEISLINNSIDYLLNIKVVKTLEGQGGKLMNDLEGKTIPLSITGSLANPQYNLDVSALLLAEATREAEEKIQEKIEDKLGEKLEGEGTLQEKLQKKAVEKVGEKLLDLFN